MAERPLYDFRAGLELLDLLEHRVPVGAQKPLMVFLAERTADLPEAFRGITNVSDSELLSLVATWFDSEPDLRKEFATNGAQAPSDRGGFLAAVKALRRFVQPGRVPVGWALQRVYASRETVQIPTNGYFAELVDWMLGGPNPHIGFLVVARTRFGSWFAGTLLEEMADPNGSWLALKNPGNHPHWLRQAKTGYNVLADNGTVFLFQPDLGSQPYQQYAARLLEDMLSVEETGWCRDPGAFIGRIGYGPLPVKLPAGTPDAVHQCLLGAALRMLLSQETPQVMQAYSDDRELDRLEFGAAYLYHALTGQWPAPKLFGN